MTSSPTVRPSARWIKKIYALPAEHDAWALGLGVGGWNGVRMLFLVLAIRSDRRLESMLARTLENAAVTSITTRTTQRVIRTSCGSTQMLSGEEYCQKV